MSSGTSTLTVAGNTFSGIGNWYVKADFYSENDCYASTVTGSATLIDIIAAEFSPRDISGILIWYNSDSLSLSDTDPVTTWADSSGNGKNLSVTSVDVPTYDASSIGSKPGVVFRTGLETLEVASAGLPQNDAARTFYFVCSPADVNTTIGGYGSSGTGTLFATQGPFYYGMQFGGGKVSNFKSAPTYANLPVYGSFSYIAGS